METIIEKRGDALIYVGLTRAKKLAHLLPPDMTVHRVLPGISFFAVGIFKYREIADLRQGNERFRWKDVYDATIQIPVDLHNTKNSFYVYRLYNTCREVVEWAKGDCLNKIPSAVEWSEGQRKLSVQVRRTAGPAESLTLTGQNLFSLPRFLWKVNPCRSLVDAHLLSEYLGARYTFQGILEVGRSYLSRVTLRAEGLDLPSPFASFGICLKDYDPLRIKPIFKLYHPCEYNPAVRDVSVELKHRKVA